ncbi:ester cyclase [Pseudovibrio sp. Alg231-02]|uniref:ester cyclase n=1 Tax=Pseudovibrio sp. Alg231-02 TaxID=1922223 RepID=UPI000D551C12|nr:ester cyclase [Pseudovibrio sp. Alg231-02]
MKLMETLMATALAVPMSLFAHGSADATLLTGRSFQYEVASYGICVSFSGENALTWTYLSAPNGETGKTADETLDRIDLTSEIVLLSWTEDNGANVVDVFDFSQMKLNASFVTPEGQRFMSVATIVEVIDCGPDRTEVSVPTTNLEVVEALYNAFNTRDVSIFSTIMAPDMVNNPIQPGTNPGPRSMQQAVEHFLEMIPDFSIKNLDVITGDGKTVVRSVIRGTPQGNLFGFETNGKSFEIEATDILEIRNGQIQEIWHMENWLGAMLQLGILNNKH